MIAIQKTNGGFDERWISYCRDNGIAYKIVDCYKSDIIRQLEDCDALMWHFYHASSKDFLFAKQLLFAIQVAGKKVFPNFATSWHFDDKVGQKYLLEAISAPLVPSYVFYSKNEAIQWTKKTNFPKVFKLRNGAGSANVRLVHSRTAAIRLIKKAFGRGFSQYNGWASLKERIRKYRNRKSDLYDIYKGIVRLFIPTKYAKYAGREKGYVYFQDFIPDNNYDIRINIVGNKAYGIKRMVRKNDFRASGSGTILYEKENLDINTIHLSFEIAEKLNAQCIVFDYLYKKGMPLISEISFGFVQEGYDQCTGYWDRDLNWHEGVFNSQEWMVQDLLKDIKKNSQGNQR